jgi:hypothetical protein
MRVTRGAYSAEDLVVAAAGDTTAALARALARIADAVSSMSCERSRMSLTNCSNSSPRPMPGDLSTV